MFSTQIRLKFLFHSHTSFKHTHAPSCQHTYPTMLIHCIHYHYKWLRFILIHRHNRLIYWMMMNMSSKVRTYTCASGIHSTMLQGTYLCSVLNSSFGMRISQFPIACVSQPLIRSLRSCSTIPETQSSEVMKENSNLRQKVKY